MIKYLQNETKRRLNKEFLFDFEAGSGSYTFKYFIIFGIFRRKMTQNFLVIEIKKRSILKRQSLILIYRIFDKMLFICVARLSSSLSTHFTTQFIMCVDRNKTFGTSKTKDSMLKLVILIPPNGFMRSD